MTLHPIPLNFPIYEENFILFFISVIRIVKIKIEVAIVYTKSEAIKTV
jgi:hypothetical protein